MNHKSIEILALTLPGGNTINNPPGFDPNLNNLGALISGLLNIALYLAAFMAFYWLVWGSFQYILASGNKESLAKARERIKWALIGLVVVFAAFFMAKLGGEIFPPGKGGLPF